jgi:6-phosphogluconolactonase (cycloisomerase 2 family)
MHPNLLISGYTRPNPPGDWTVDDPSWLVYAPDTGEGEMVFALGESEVGTLARLRRGDCWQAEVAGNSGGSLPCHAALVGTTLFVAHYGDGAVVAFPDATKGPLTQPVTLVAPSRGAHAHGVFGLPAGSGLLVVDLGLETVRLLPLDSTGKPSARPEAFLATGKGSGPRHLALHPALGRAYLVTEYSNELLTLTWGTSPAHLSLLERRSLLPASWQGSSFGGSVRVSPDGKFVLATNRGHESVVSFPLDANGLPGAPQWTACGGSWPRDLALNRGGTQLAVTNQRSDLVTVFDRNRQTGQLTPGAVHLWKQPSCVLWN